MTRRGRMSVQAHGAREVVGIHPSADQYGSDQMFALSMSVFAALGPVMAVVPEGGPLVEDLRSHGVDVRQVAFPVLRRNEVRGLRALRWGGRAALALPKIVRLLRSNDGPVYVSTIVNPICLIAARLAGRPSICHVHENEQAMPLWAARILLSPLLLCDSIIANSRSTQGWIHAAWPSLARRTHLLYNGVEEPSEGDVSLGAAAHHLVVVGRLSERKGQGVAIRALGHLVERGLDVDLAIVGDVYKGYDWVRRDLEAQVARQGLGDRVSFVGFRPAGAYLRAADVVVLPSYSESFGLVAAEAQLAARPVVASAAQGLREIVEDGVSGLTVRPGAPLELADAVQRLLEDPRLAQELAQAGRESAQAMFSVQAYRRRIAELITAVSAGARHG